MTPQVLSAPGRAFHAQSTPSTHERSPAPSPLGASLSHAGRDGTQLFLPPPKPFFVWSILLSSLPTSPHLSLKLGPNAKSSQIFSPKVLRARFLSHRLRHWACTGVTPVLTPGQAHSGSSISQREDRVLMLDIRHRILQGSSAYLSTSEFIVVFLSNMTFRMSPMALAAGGRDGCGYDEICVKRLGRTPLQHMA